MTNAKDKEDKEDNGKELPFGLTKEDIAEADRQEQEIEEVLSKSKRKRTAKAEKKKPSQKQVKEEERRIEEFKDAFKVTEEEKIKEVSEELPITVQEKYRGKKINGALKDKDLKVSREKEMTPEEIEEARKEQEEEDEKKKFEKEDEKRKYVELDVTLLNPENPADIHTYMAYRKIDDPVAAKKLLIDDIEAIIPEAKGLYTVIHSLDPFNPRDVRRYMEYKHLDYEDIAKSMLIDEKRKLESERKKEVREKTGIGYEIEVETAEDEFLEDTELCAYVDNSKRIVIQKNCVPLETARRF
ncbi:MAG: hypothetical protein ABSF14_23810 [Terriglobia bacterium]